MPLISKTPRLSLLTAGLLVLSILSFSANASNTQTSSKPTTDIVFSQIHSKTAVDITHKLAAYHYQDVNIDNELSSQFFDAYIKRLDPSKIFLYKSDIEEFEVHRFTMDDSIKKGDLTAGLIIFNRYQHRVLDRLNFVLNNLHDTLSTLDFTVNESIDISREDTEFPADIKEANEIWRQRVKGSVLNLKLAKKDLNDIEDLMRKRYNNQIHRVEQTNNEDAFEIFINALTHLYDPHTSYLSPRTSENFNINMKLSLEGIGAVLQQEDEYTKVVRLVTAGPADKQGDLQPADRITGVAQGINGEIIDVIGWRLDEVVDKIRGKKDSTVRLQVIPANAEHDEDFKIITIVRNKVKLEEQSAQKKVIEITNDNNTYKLGVIELPTFYIDFDAVRRGDPNFRSTTRDVKRLITELKMENVQGIIIDLRGNGGGSLEEATKLTDLFIKAGPTVQIRNSNGRISRQTKSPGDIFYEGPIAVLIDRMSASASEIFAGAIQDYQRGIIIGNQSFGKGTVQLLTRLRQGQLKLTQSKFYRISGESTQHRGVIPDIEFPSIYDATIIGESSLDNALEWDQILPAKHYTYSELKDAVPELINKHEERTKEDPDFIYLLDQISLVNKNSDRKTLSLSESIRVQEKEEFSSKELAILNKRRASKGKPPFKTIKDRNDEFDKKKEARAEAKKSKNTNEIDLDEEPDPYLMESGHILIDVLTHMSTIQNRKVADTKSQN